MVSSDIMGHRWQRAAFSGAGAGGQDRAGGQGRGRGRAGQTVELNRTFRVVGKA